MWTFFNGDTCLNLHGWIVTPISSNEPWVLFSASSSLGQDKQFIFIRTLCYQWAASCILLLFIPLSRHSNLMHLCIGLLPLLSLSFLLEAKPYHCLVLTMFLFIIVREHHCKMYKKHVVVHYPLLYHLKSILHDHKDQGVLNIR